MDEDTRLTHAGSNPQAQNGAVNPPVVRASTVVFPDLASLRAAAAQPFAGFFYGRFGTPTHAALADALNAIAGGAGTVFYPSGLAAVAGVILSQVRAGERILVVDCVYQPTRKFCDSMLRDLGVDTQYFAPDIGADIAALIDDRTRMVFCESPGSLTMEVQDLPAIAQVTRARDVVLAVDNTWATPLHCPVLQLGADVDIQALTKYVGGHADLLSGAAICNKRAWARVQGTAVRLGHCCAADDAWLALRGLRTLGVRLRQHAHNAARLMDWLARQPEVRRILSPAWVDDPGHAMWQRDFRGGNGLFSVELEPQSPEALAAFADGLRYFGLGFSWGGFESLCLPFEPGPARTATDWSKPASYLRFHAGLEGAQDLLADLSAGFARMRQSPRA